MDQIVEAITDRFGMSPLKAYRLAHGWTRPQAVEALLTTYDADGLRRPRLRPQRLCAWEHDPKVRPGEDYLDRLCRIYQTRPDRLGYGRDYAPPVAQGTVDLIKDGVGEASRAVYAGAQARSLVAVAGGDDGGVVCDAEVDGQEAVTDRSQFLRTVGLTGVAALLDRAKSVSAWLSRRLEESNAGPAALEHLESRVSELLHHCEHTPLEPLFGEVFAQRQQVVMLLEGRQSLAQRRGLYRIAGQLSVTLAGLSVDLGDYSGAHAHGLTALQCAEEVGDHTLIGFARLAQSTAALWVGDPRMALGYAQDGQRYATGTGAMRARLAVQGEARAYARMRDRGGVMDALERAGSALSSQPAVDDPEGYWSVFSPGSLHLYSAVALLWLSQLEQAEQHAREAIAWYEAAPVALQSPAGHAQARINLAICLVSQDRPEEGISLAAEALDRARAHTASNLQQAREFVAALSPQHRALPAAREFQEQLRTLSAPNPAPHVEQPDPHSPR